ncbi:SDR family oxidoreductase [Flaviflexus massiliensis]|uniref:SDR family oxidoreductase n=1 Tax=Flaviflexus massiliensis TaxID=1522309 RepID=UPI0006D53F63|nr:SDR family oxidoreductase [Flaviflexus massiliensis]
MANYLIIGGHGKVALLAAPLLVDEGHSVTSIIRNPDHTSDVENTGAKPLVLDIESATVDDLVEAMGGMDAVVWSAGAGGGNPARTRAVDYEAATRSIDAAKQAGVGRYVMVSHLGSRLDHGVPEDNSFHTYATAKAEADEYLRASGLDFTILGPGSLTLEEPSGSITVHQADYDGPSETSRSNVARTIVAALNNNGSICKTIRYSDGDTPIDTAID